MRQKEIEEMESIKKMPFQPKTGEFKGTRFDVSLAERTSRWAEKKNEKMKRKKEEIQQKENEICSFKPKIVRFFS